MEVYVRFMELPRTSMYLHGTSSIAELAIYSNFHGSRSMFHTFSWKSISTSMYFVEVRRLIFDFWKWQNTSLRRHVAPYGSQKAQNTSSWRHVAPYGSQTTQNASLWRHVAPYGSSPLPRRSHFRTTYTLHFKVVEIAENLKKNWNPCAQFYGQKISWP